MFTATAIGLLVDQKNCPSTTRVGRFFSDYPNQMVRDKVTLGMFVAHTAGMGDFLDRRTPERMKKGVKWAAELGIQQCRSGLGLHYRGEGVE